jgi:glycosyltransferase involved in cell wall biosynthesis
MLRSTGVDARLIIMGDGPERTNLDSIIRSKALQQDVVLTGFQEDLRPFMSICDCLTLTSKAESFPLSVIEGMAMGKPVVSSEVGGTPEQIEHGVTGFLYRLGDVEQIVSYLKILSDPVRRAQMGDRAKQTARDRFSFEKMVSEYNQVLETLVPDR